MRRFAEPGPERHALARAIAQQLAARKAGTGSSILVSDPIVILAPRTDQLFDPSADDDDPDPAASAELTIDIAPDALHKANLSGGLPYSVVIPNHAVDGPVRGTGSSSLVEYLREAFRWGGFPGLARLRLDTPLEWLTAGLLEI